MSDWHSSCQHASSKNLTSVARKENFFEKFSSISAKKSPADPSLWRIYCPKFLFRYENQDQKFEELQNHISRYSGLLSRCTLVQFWSIPFRKSKNEDWKSCKFSLVTCSTSLGLSGNVSFTLLCLPNLITQGLQVVKKAETAESRQTY